MQRSIDHPPTSSDLQLTDEQLDRLRAALALELDDHRRRADENADLFEQLASDASIDASERQSARQAASAAAAICEQVEEALSAIDAGSYGRCASCAKPIPFERLEAIPMTDSCVTCQG